MFFLFLMNRAAIIYSHGNASDCGSMLPRCMQLSEKLNVDIIIYDYEGYGYSTGGYCRETICEDVEIVYDYVHQFFPASCIFLYGESSMCFASHYFLWNSRKCSYLTSGRSTSSQLFSTSIRGNFLSLSKLGKQKQDGVLLSIRSYLQSNSKHKYHGTYASQTLIFISHFIRLFQQNR